MKKHYYQTSLLWTGNRGQGTTNYRSYNREYEIRVDGKPVLHGSSDPSFRGNSSLYNPEELFLASISSCHMIWYLHLCSEIGVTVIDYKDNAKAVMIEEESGAGFFKSVVLSPKVLITEAEKKNLAMNLHKNANKMCFIANSCNFQILHEPLINIQENK